MSIYAIYITIFGISFFILSLQIILAILFKVVAFSQLLAIALTFLGLSTAGIFSYIRYFRKDDFCLEKYLFRYMNIVGMLMLIYTLAIKYYSIIILKKKIPVPNSSWYQKSIEIFYGSFSIIIGFAILFFCLGVVISLIYKQYSDKAPKLYFFDLIGAACGCIFGTIIFDFLQLSSILILFSFFSFFLLLLVTLKNKKNKIAKITAFFFMCIAGLLLIINLKTDFLEPELNPSEFIRNWNTQEETREIWHRWNMYSRISLIKYKKKGDRHYSYNFVINNASGGVAQILPFQPRNPYSLTLFKRFSVAALGFLLDKPQDILILFAGAGKDMIQAYSYSQGTSNITGVELNPLIVNKAIDLPEFNLKGFFAKENVNMVVQEGRNYLESTNKLFDTIILSWSGASAAQYLGIPNYTGQYLYTKEALVSYLEHLKPNGTIAIINIDKIKLLAMAKEAFKQLGDNNFSTKIIIFDKKEAIGSGESKRKFFSFFNDNIPSLIKKAGFSRDEVDRIEKNISKMGMEWIYNPYYTHKDFRFIEDFIRTKNTESFLEALSKRYHLNFDLPTDNKPFAKNTYLTKESLRLGNFITNLKSMLFSKRWTPTLFISLHLCLNIALLLIGLLFIILPLATRIKTVPKAINFKFLAYFSILGLGFISVEIGIMQTFTLFLGNPTYSFSIVLASMLLASGIGSFLSEYLFEKGYLNIKKISLLSSFILLLYFFFLPYLNKHFLYLNFFGKFLTTFTLILLIGFCIGMFFPQGLKKAYAHDKHLISWAWGLNGYMGILGSVLSPYVAWTMGFSWFFLIAAFLYLIIIFINIENNYY